MPNKLVKYDGPLSPPQSSFVQTVRQRLYQAYEGFFGPLLPLDQQAPQGTEKRVFDFSAGTNLSYIPRSDEPVSFAQLRALADSYYLLRMVIETRKDQISKVKWRFGLKAKPGESRQLSRKKSENDSRVQKISRFFEYPDGRHDWQKWLSMIVEDMLVIDAPTLLIRRDRAGEVIGLRPIDGSTIHPVINNEGVAPEPPEYAYQQIIKGMVLSNLTTEEMLYFPRVVRTHKKYGFSPVEQIILIINLGLRRAIHQINYYTEGNIPEAICQVPDTWSPDQVKQFQTWFNSALTGQLAARRRLTFIPGLGGKDAIQFTKDATLKDEMDEYLARAVCFAFSLPPTAFVKQQNRATAQTAQQTALQEGLEPLKAYVKSFIDQIIQSPQYMNQAEVEITAEDEAEIDQLKQAQIDQIYVSVGVRSIDEIRERDGLDTIGVGCGIITAQGFVPFEDGQALLPSAAAPPETPKQETGEKDPATDAEPSPAAKMLKAATKVKKKVTVSTALLPSAATKRATGLSRNIARFLKKQGKKIAAQATEAYSHVTKDDSSDEVDRILAEVDLDWAALVTSLDASIGETARESAKDTLVQVGVADDEVFNLVNQDALDFARERAASLVGKKVVNGELIDNPDAEYAITETTREELRQIISKAFSEGMTPAELEQAIEDSFQFSDTRSEMIARTEMAKAHVAGALVAAKRSGVVVGKSILLGSEHTGPDECDVAVAQGTIPLDEDFNSGDDGPPLHPNCLVGNAVVAAAGIAANTKRWFHGEVVKIRIPGENNLTITPNHPVLTDCGWVPAGKLKKGSRLLHSRFQDLFVRLLSPDDHLMPTAIEQVACALGKSGAMTLTGMPVSAEDFHGDGVTDSEVDIVLAARSLKDEGNRVALKKRGKLSLLQRHVGDTLLAGLRLLAQSPVGALRSSNSFVGSGDYEPSLRGAISFPGHSLRFSDCTDRQPEFLERFANGKAMESGSSGEGNTGFSGHVTAMECPSLAVSKAATLLLPSAPESLGEREYGEFESAEIGIDRHCTNANVLTDFLHRLAALVSFVELEDEPLRESFSGHVYNLETANGFYLAEGLIIHNCVCGLELIYEGES